MNKQRAVTYSVLSHIRNKGELIGGPIDIFVPLIKRVLSILNEEGVFSGASIKEIQTKTNNLYSIDFPIPVIETILKKISKDVNTDKEIRFVLNQDKSFQIKNYVFTEFEETIRLYMIEIENLEKIFKEFCETCGQQVSNSSSILEFIETNKLSLSKYLAHKSFDQEKDFTIEAQFVEYFKLIPSVYDLIRKIYLGSILASFIEYKTTEIQTNVELLFDTNFILGLIDLNTPESTHTCRKLVEITSQQGYKLTIMQETINECIGLLIAKVRYFDTTFLQHRVYPEDIYNACERRGLHKSDLERIADNLKAELASYKISVVHDTTKYRNIARFSREYKTLKKYRNNDLAALHDATAVHYVRTKRTKKIKEFEKVNCWFVNNSISREKNNGVQVELKAGFQPETIKADDFLNIIWLSNPQINASVNGEELIDIGLTSLISLALTDSLPKASVIRELDDNIHKYASEKLTDADIVRISTRITNKQLKDIDGLNKIAKNDKEGFVTRLNKEAQKQALEEGVRIKKLENIFKDLSDKDDDLQKIKSDLEKKSKTYDQKLSELKDHFSSKDEKISELEAAVVTQKKKVLGEKNKKRKSLREEYYKKQLYKWRIKTWIEFCIWLVITIFGVVGLLWWVDWRIEDASVWIQYISSNLAASVLVFLLGTIFSGITVKTLFNKYRNHSNIEAYKKTIDLPEDIEDLVIGDLKN